MSYIGSKGQDGVWQRIIGQMPPHDVYVEPFAGSAQIFFKKRPARHSILIDKDSAAIASLRAAVRNAGNGDGGHGEIEILNECALRRLEVWTRDFYRLPPSAVVYCDPPYLLSTRKHRRYYEHELDDLAHARLLALLQALKCRVLLSGYPSELYSWYLSGWRCLSYRTRTRGRTVTECLWCNFPEPTELHDWRYAGRNFRQRLAYRRLAARWLARLEGMPPLKRGYVLDAISQRQDGRVGPEASEVARHDRATPELARGAVEVV